MPLSPRRLVGIAIFVLLGLGLFAAGLFVIGSKKLAFTPKFTIYTEFAKLNGLQSGADVDVAGMKAGQVDAIQLPSGPTKKFRLKIEIREDLHPLVRTDSMASIETQGVVGGSFLSVAAGSADQPQAPEGSTLPSKEPFSIGDLIEKAGDTVQKVDGIVAHAQGQVDRILASAATISDNVGRISGHLATATGHLDGHVGEIVRDVQRITAAGAAITTDIQQITDNIRSGRGTLGRFFTDDQVYEQVAGAARSARVIARQIASITGQIDQMIHKVTASGGPAQGMMTDLTQTMNNARTALGHMSDAMTALEHNFLLRGFFHDRGYFDLSQLSPSEYRAGVLAQGDRQRLQIWLKADVLFAKGADGKTALTDDGRARLDSAMADFLPYLPDAVLVVEGYATEGAQTQRFVVSRERASLVRSYLLDRFHLDPRKTGLMPLGAEAPGSPDAGRWSGVALSLFVERDRLASGPRP
jgi:phospholipid/cholesterol/gamma-HCH transport system substrate-binding protein